MKGEEKIAGPVPEIEQIRDIGSRLEPLVDGYLIDKLRGARLKLHHPARREVVMRFDEPWEGRSCCYVTILQDDDRYRMYYRGSGRGHEVICYAESEDGVDWRRPALGIHSFEGSADNNIIWVKERSHCFMVFKDEKASIPDSERYKAFASGSPEGRMKRILALASPDGIHWHEMQEEPVITQQAMDWGADLAFWDSEREQYVAYVRGWRTPSSRKQFPLQEEWHAADREVMTDEGQLFRQILRSTSPDFLHWSKLSFVEYGDAPLEHFYTNAITPYFRAPHIYVAFPKRFSPERKVVPDHPVSGVSDGVFMSSRDGVHWDRTFLEAFLRPGRHPKNWTDRSNMIAWGILPTAPDELSIYWVEHYRHPSCRLRRGTMRVDGFASVHAPYEGGDMVTHPLRFQGSELVVNSATSAVGSLRVEIQDADGNPLPGYRLEDSELFYGDEIGHSVVWKSGMEMARLAGQSVRLRFVLKDADLYSFQFQ